MDGLYEIVGARQIPGERPRRWFSCAQADLIVWLESGQPWAFQFCYDKRGRECALSWHPRAGWRHERVDNGEGSVLSPKRTPVLLPSADYHGPHIAARFELLNHRLPPDTIQFVASRLANY